MTKVNVTEEINMMIPSDFRLMTDDEMASRYFTTKKPVAIYTDQTVMVDLGINQSATEWIVDDLEIMVSFQKSNIYNFYDDIEMIDQGIKEVDGKKAAYFEFISTVKPEGKSFRSQSPVKKYTYIQYMIVGEHSWVFNFSSPVQLQSIWQPQVINIMNSVIFLKKKK
ncbi:hypothetical protein N7E81_00965 [Reichenbachiella carrageenanivorans]|uniref:Uncharacterized protein n=1 Tax=Reichenbachiella carrageenanivorans TaxID=2979869 RepID=A0ABY6D0I0_9BACT|nr:hypothetical protein [Reichenbachiella carrageenanivorans]UXX79681.1 hypothetical protein N7E81_00965 [Reichenbachiella carrageenanivorans]